MRHPGTRGWQVQLSGSPREHEREHVTSACCSKGGCTRVERGARRADVVDEEHARVSNRRVIAYRERMTHVREPLRSIEESLLRGMTKAYERARRAACFERARDRTRQQRRLVVAALREASRVERHGHDDVDRAAQALDGGHHRPAEAWPEIGAVRILEARDRSRDRAAVLEDGDAASADVRLEPLDGRGARRAKDEAARDGLVAGRASRRPDELADQMGGDGADQTQK